MQTLKIGTGRTEKDYDDAVARERADLLAESRSNADFFFWAAACAVLGTGLLPIRINIFFSLGLIDYLAVYGRVLGTMHGIILYALAAAWVLLLLGLGFAARAAHRWAFLAGIGLYAVDMLALLALFSIWSFGLHAFFVFKWYQGQQALKELDGMPVQEPSATA